DGDDGGAAAGVESQVTADRRVRDLLGRLGGRGHGHVQVALDVDVVHEQGVLAGAGVDRQGLADRHDVGGVGDGVVLGTEADRVVAAAAGAGKRHTTGDLVAPEFTGVDCQGAGGERDVAEAGVAGEGDDAGAAVDLRVAAEIGVVGDGGRIGAAAQV